MSTIINLTPHDINFYSPLAADKGVIKSGATPYCTIAPTFPSCRCVTTTRHRGYLQDIPVSSVSYGEVENLPDPAPDTFYIVSAIAGARAVKDGRKDVLTIAGAVRNSAGQIVGCTGLSFPANPGALPCPILLPPSLPLSIRHHLTQPLT